MAPEVIYNHGIYTQILNPWNVVLMLSTWLAIRIVRQVFPELFSKKTETDSFWGNLPRRLMPVYPILICTFFYIVVAGPWIDPSLGLGERTLLGILCGSIAGHGHAILVRLLPEPIRIVFTEERKKDRE